MIATSAVSTLGRGAEDVPSPVDPRRVVVHRGGAPRAGARYVLYWCQVQKRAEHHPALRHAVACADALALPLVVYEGLRVDYPHASWRHHRFILDGAADLGRRLAARGIAHYFYLQQDPGERRPLLLQLAAQAALVITDDYPAFVAPRHTARAAARLDCPLLSVDGAGVAPMRAFPTQEAAAFTLRPKLKRLLPGLLDDESADLPAPARDSLSLRLDEGLPGLRRAAALPEEERDLDALCLATAVDRSVRPVPGVRGGRAAGLRRLRRFLDGPLARYGGERRSAGEELTSKLSPYLHYGMLSSTEVARAARDASPAGLADDDVAAFLEQLVVRRELALNFCLHRPDHDALTALPPWAKESLARHGADRRPHTYDLATLERAATHDPLWNAVQEELRETGEPNGYLRMLWGKQLIAWSPSYEAALEWMKHLNDKYAYDGRDASSYASFLWCFGVHDRPFPRRPVFGLLRPMTSASTGRKAGGAAYIERVRRYREASQSSGSSGTSPRATSK